VVQRSHGHKTRGARKGGREGGRGRGRGRRRRGVPGVATERRKIRTDARELQVLRRRNVCEKGVKMTGKMRP